MLNLLGTFLNRVATVCERCQTRETLRAARALIERGWIKFHYEDTIDGEKFYCASGAVQAASGRNDDKRGWVVRGVDADRALERALLFPHRTVVAFNDASQTMKADVLALFDRAIANL